MDEECVEKLRLLWSFAELPDSTLYEAFRRIRQPDHYLRSYSVEQLGLHMALMAKLDDDKDVVLRVFPGERPHHFRIVVVGEDRPGACACVAANLWALGLNIGDGSITTYERDEVGGEFFELEAKYVMEFDVDTFRGPLTAAELQERLRVRIETVYPTAALPRGEDIPADGLATRAARWPGTNPLVDIARAFSALPSASCADTAMFVEMMCPGSAVGASGERMVAINSNEFDMIDRSAAAYRRELPLLLESQLGQWVAYVDETNVGVAETKSKLIEQCKSNGYPYRKLFLTQVGPLDTMYAGWI